MLVLVYSVFGMIYLEFEMMYFVFGMIYLVFGMIYLVLLIAFTDYNPPVPSFVIANLEVELQEPKVSRQSGAR